MRRFLAGTVLTIAASAAPAAEPAPGSALRKEILSTLRPTIERRLGAPVEFKVTVIRVEGSWAFLVVDPQRPGGRPIDGHKIFGEHFDNMDGLRAEAVLRREKGKWRVVDHALGATDVWDCDVGPKSLKRDWGC